MRDNWHGTDVSPWRLPSGGSLKQSRRLDEEKTESWWLDVGGFYARAKREQGRIATSRLAHVLSPVWPDA